MRAINESTRSLWGLGVDMVRWAEILPSRPVCAGDEYVVANAKSSSGVPHSGGEYIRRKLGYDTEV